MENAKLVASATQSCVVKMLISISLLLSKSIHIREILFFLPKKHDVFKSVTHQLLFDIWPPKTVIQA